MIRCQPIVSVVRAEAGTPAAFRLVRRTSSRSYCQQCGEGRSYGQQCGWGNRQDEAGERAWLRLFNARGVRAPWRRSIEPCRV
jgi:hypothetical protein